MEMIERVARAMCDGNWDATNFNETPNGEEPEDQREYWREKARAAIEAIFAGSRMTEFRDGIVIANPDFPVHFWNGTSMEEVKPADPNAARIGE